MLAGELPNLASVTFDRSPYQERAPIVAAERLPLLAWLRFGSTVFIRKHAEAARDPGPYEFGCDALRQRYDDCAYLPMNHDDLYVRFADVWREVIGFVRTGRFSDTADRRVPADDTTAQRRMK